MLSKEEIIDNILYDAQINPSETVKNRVESLLHQKYLQICNKHPWQALRRKTSLDFSTASGGTGLWLPANMAGIEMVMDETNKFEILPRDRADIQFVDYTYRYYTYVPDNTALFEAEDLYLSHGATTFTSADLTTDATNNAGEYVRFANQRGYYLLTAAMTFTPQYNGPDESESHFEIRPKYSEKMVLVDSSAAVLETRTHHVHYWEVPMPLYEDSDVSVLPDDNVLELAILAALPEAKARRPVTKSMQEEALAEARALNPDLPRRVAPRDKGNQLFKNSAQDHYSQRTG